MTVWAGGQSCQRIVLNEVKPMDDKEKDSLRINSLDRFSKNSPKLILEEHSHCEVPAGCGGVVLRWINPEQSRPILLRMYTRVDASVYIDGQTISSSSRLMSTGRHVLAIILSSGPENSETTFLFAVFHKNTSAPIILSLPDGTWKFTTSTPAGETWMHVGFDDSSWQTLTGIPFRKPDRREEGSLAYEDIANVGGQAIGVTSPRTSIFVRREFEVKGIER